MKDFINMVGNKGCLAAEYWLPAPGAERVDEDLPGRMLEGRAATLIMAIRLH